MRDQEGAIVLPQQARDPAWLAGAWSRLHGRARRPPKRYPAPWLAGWDWADHCLDDLARKWAAEMSISDE